MLRPVSLALLIGWVALPAHAGLFDDEEARKAIIDLRGRQSQAEVRQNELSTQNSQLIEQIQQLRRSLLELNNQLEAMRADLARQRGQGEQLARDVAELQRQQKDVLQGTDERLRKLEPQKVSLDGKEFTVEADEKRLYEEALVPLRNSDFPAAAAALGSFLKRYPSSGYADSARFWLGNAQYGKRDYKDAIASFRSFVTAAPENVRAPEALLSIANCQAEMKDNKGARRTLDELVRVYPKSEAAQAGKERLATLK
jgi:tol-pal system protein YbgF